MNSNDEVYDIIIVGGGAVGAYTALDATLRGYRVQLIEKNDFASGASSKSSKLVHGGIRYLEKAIKELDNSQYNLVKEGLNERSIFLRNSPFFSKKIKINIPIYSYFNLIYTYFGILIYKLIAKNKSLGKNHFFNKVVSTLFFSNIKQENLKGMLSFYDGSFIDIRMVISLLQTAQQNGCEVKNYCEVREFLYDKNYKICGVKYFDKMQNQTYEINAKVVINATGANADNIRTLDDKESKEILALSSGTHIVVSKDLFNINEGILIPNTSDGRVIFLLPYLNHFLIGTTDNPTVYEENPKAKEKEIEFLLNEINSYFEKAIKKEDILSSWSGIRPLVKNENKNETQQLVREHIITTSKNGLVTIVGGKWTTYRKMGQELVDFLENKQLIEKLKECETKKYKLLGNNSNENELDKLMNFYPISKATKESLKTIYGSSCTQILNIANEKDNFELIHPKLPYLKAEIAYCINYEFVQKPIDFLSRRVGLCFVNKKLALACVDIVCDEMAMLLSWDETRINKEKFECKEFINNNF